MPKLRFPEFDEEWEEIKGKEIFDVLGGGAFSSKDSQDDGVKWLKIVNVGINKIESNEVSYLPFGYQKIYGRYLLRKENIVIALTRPILSSKLKIALIDGYFDKSLLNQRVGKFIPKEGGVKNFIYYLLQLTKNIAYIENEISGTDPPNLSIKDLINIPLMVPSIIEQLKIASFLSKVDEKIEKLEKKQELWETYKNGIMQQIFSQKLRFKDENEDYYPDWEKKRLGNIANFSKGKNISKSDISNEGLDCIRYGELYTTYKEKIDHIMSKTKLNSDELVLSEKNDIIIPTSGETAIDIATASYIMKDGVAIGGDTTIIKSSENGLFISYYMNSLRNKIARLAQGVSVVHLYTSNLKELELKIPIIEEQSKIANFLTAIESKIELINEELMFNKEFKKGLLQQMFC